MIPTGALTLLTGEPDNGKSVLTLDWAARVSRGTPWPDGKRCPRGTTVFLSPEDGEGSTAVPRFDAAGGDPKRAMFVQGVRRPGATAVSPFSLARDVEQLDVLLRNRGDVRLVVIDPLNAYLVGVNTGRDSEVRAVLDPLIIVARRHRVAIVGVVHLNKSVGQRAMYRSLGSIGIQAVARAAWLVAPDPRGGEEARVLLPVKFNVRRKPPGIAFRLVPAEKRPSVPVVKYDAFDLHLTADEVLANSARETAVRATDRAAEFLRQSLSDHVTISAQELQKRAKAAQIAWRTIARVKEEVGVESFKDGGVWAYRLRPAGEKNRYIQHCQDKPAAIT